MDRRRLENAHFQYAILQVASWYPQHLDITTLALHGSTKDTLLSVVAKYHGVFMAQYASIIDDMATMTLYCMYMNKKTPT